MVFMMWCRLCQMRAEVHGVIGHLPYAHCASCGLPLRRYYSTQTLPMMNLGYVASHYSTQEDADIAKFQFTNL